MLRMNFNRILLEVWVFYVIHFIYWQFNDLVKRKMPTIFYISIVWFHCRWFVWQWCSFRMNSSIFERIEVIKPSIFGCIFFCQQSAVDYSMHRHFGARLRTQHWQRGSWWVRFKKNKILIIIFFLSLSLSIEVLSVFWKVFCKSSWVCSHLIDFRLMKKRLSAFCFRLLAEQYSAI